MAESHRFSVAANVLKAYLVSMSGAVGQSRTRQYNLVIIIIASCFDKNTQVPLISIRVDQHREKG